MGRAPARRPGRPGVVTSRSGASYLAAAITLMLTEITASPGATCGRGPEAAGKPRLA
jgi:hypothetical protein